MIDYPVLGYRAWRSVAQYGLLPDRKTCHKGAICGPFYTSPWRPGENEADCSVRAGSTNTHHLWPMPRIHWPHEPAPGEECNCGFNAHHTMVQLFDHTFVAKECIVGVVKGWGKGFLAPNGWRTQFAEIQCFISLESKPSYLRPAAKYYGVPILPHKNIEIIAEEFGRFVPRDEWPKISG